MKTKEKKRKNERKKGERQGAHLKVDGFLFGPEEHELLVLLALLGSGGGARDEHEVDHVLRLHDAPQLADGRAARRHRLRHPPLSLPLTFCSICPPPSLTATLFGDFH